MTIFAYGQTSTGKTFTMQGNIPNNEGIIPLTLKEIFDKIYLSKDITNSKITVSFIEIYNENINDLLDSSKTNLDLRETPNKEVIVNNLTEIKINNHEEAMNLLLKGNESRIVASTKLNEKSSRSHSIFRLNVEITKKKENINNLEIDEKIILKSHINLIDLAGSENSNKTGCVGQRLKEGSNINKSLLALSNVINKLSQNNGNNGNGQNVFVNYRDSKLTRLLQNSLGGNSKTTIICTITDDSEHYNETMNTLHFGNKAKNIKTVVKVNEIKNQNCQQMLLENERLKKKLKELEKELTTQKKLRINEILMNNENNNKENNKDLNLTAPPKLNLNNSYLYFNTNNNNISEEKILTKSNKTKSLSFNRTQLALNNMEKELSLLKQYLLTEQKENINNNINYFEMSSSRSSDICRNLTYSNNKNNRQIFQDKDSYKSSAITLCNVEHFVLKNEKNDKIKELEEENNRLKYELSLIKNKNMKTDVIDLKESYIDKNNKIIDDKKKRQKYFFNKGRKILLSKFSNIKFINNFPNQINNYNKNNNYEIENENKDSQILIDLNQTIKNLSQNNVGDIDVNKKCIEIKRKETNFLQRKSLNKDN